MKTFKDKNILKAKTKIKISNKFQLTIFFLLSRLFKEILFKRE